MLYIVDKIQLIVTLLALIVISVFEFNLLIACAAVVISYFVANYVREKVLSVISEKDSFQAQ